MNLKTIYIALFASTTLSQGCGDNWLNVKRSLNLTVPESLDDMQALLNHSMLRHDYLTLAELSADEYEVDKATYDLLGPKERNAYLWQSELYEGAHTVEEWDNSYQQVFQCNIVLDGLKKLTPSPAEESRSNRLQGTALFFRGKAFFNLAQLFAQQYDSSDAEHALGIPLKLTADVNERTQRASLEATYTQILEDLLSSSRLLAIQASGIYQPSKGAAFAALSRCYLVMGQYRHAGLYADSALLLKSALLDYNEIATMPTYPITPLNAEVIFPSTLSPLNLVFFPAYSRTPDRRLEEYDDDDRRKSVLFAPLNNGKPSYRGSYTGSVQLFSGTTTAEMMLIRAECAVRTGEDIAALNDLNTLLEKRLERENYNPIVGIGGDELLERILAERRKELVRRGLRWQDLRRLNRDGGTSTVLERTFNAITYTLEPGSPRYTMPIPDYIIDLAGITQNNRL